MPQRFSYVHFVLSAGLQEEVRMAVETCTHTLLPPHFDAISLCWSEALNKVPVTDRVKLVSFLTQLRTHFPLWKGMDTLTLFWYFSLMEFSCGLGRGNGIVA